MLTLILIIAIPLFCWFLGFSKILIACCVFLYTSAMFFLSFIIGVMLAYAFNPEAARLWEIPDFWLYQLIQSIHNLGFMVLVAPLAPALFVIDLYRLVFYFNIVNFNIVIFVFTLLGIYLSANIWYLAIKSYQNSKN